jgi:hypothetical protein
MAKISLDSNSITYPEELMIARLITEQMQSNNLTEYSLSDNLLGFSDVWIEDGEVHYDLFSYADKYNIAHATNLVKLACLHQAFRETFSEIEYS